MLEQISMYMTALPCPPLPVMLAGFGQAGQAGQDSEKKEEIQLCTSHDLLAGLLISAMVRGNRELNEQRKQRQLQITRTLLDKCLASSDATEMYAFCKEFTAEYVHAFDDAGTCTPAVCFLAVDEVAAGDKVHLAACSWHAAQDILYLPKVEQRKAAVFAKRSYAELIQAHWLRMHDEPTLVA